MMGQRDPVRWNIFARELENILEAHGWQLGYLDDRGIVLQREKVRRLQQSLLSPTHFPILNPEELDRLITALHLTDGEQNRLHAAIVATAVERTLMDRVSPNTALLAADEVFGLCFSTMGSQPNLTLATGVKGDTVVYDWYSTEDIRFDEMLDALDEGTLALFAARNAMVSRLVVSNAHKAQTAFAHARELLDQIRIPVSDPPAQASRLAWYSEIDSGYKVATALLASDSGTATDLR